LDILTSRYECNNIDELIIKRNTLAIFINEKRRSLDGFFPSLDYDKCNVFSSNGLVTITFNTKETVIELNGIKIEAFPSHHLDAMRGLPNVSFILLDEADFFPPGQQADVRDVSERYIAKSNP
jgi:hypothetical protein